MSTIVSTSTVIHIGHDPCRRVLVLENAGLRVRLSGETEPEFREVLDDTDGLVAVTISDERVSQHQPGVIESVRTFCVAPLILFHNPVRLCDESKFDLIIPALTPPTVWVPTVLQAIEVSRRICESSRQLCENSGSVRAEVRAEIARAIRELNRAVDLDAVWRGDGDK